MHDPGTSNGLFEFHLIKLFNVVCTAISPVAIHNMIWSSSFLSECRQSFFFSEVTGAHIVRFFKQSHNRVLHEYILVCYTTGNPDIITSNTLNSACQCKDLDKFACSHGELLFVHKWWMYTQGKEQRHRQRQSQILSPIISTVILFHLWQGLKDNPGFLFHQPTNMSQNSCHGVCTWKLNKSKIMQLSSYTVSKTIPLATIHIKNMDTLKP